MGQHNQQNQQSLYVLILIFIIFSACIIGAGYFHYSHHKKQYKDEVGKQLTAIGKLKTDQLVNWRRERLGDASTLCKNTLFSKLVSKYFDAPDNADVRGQLEKWLNQFRTAYNYRAVILLDAHGVKRIFAPKTSEVDISHITDDITKVMRSGDVAFLDFHRHSIDNQICLGALAPILDLDNNRPIGIIVLSIDPKEYLYPYVVNWPLASMTAETLLALQAGDSVEFLNELKFQDGAALSLKRPITDINLPAAKAVLGYEGIVDGIDYRGVPVIADVRSVPDSPWFMVTRMDVSEVYAPLKQRLLLVIAFIAILLGGAGASLGFVWRQMRIRYYREQYESAKKWCNIFDSLPDWISIVGTDFKFKLVNKTFADVFGKQPCELLGKQCCKLIHNKKRPPEYCPLKKVLSTGKAAKAEIYYDALRKHLEISAYPILGDNGEIVEAVHYVRDITKQKLMEEARKKTDTLLQNALKFNSDIISNASAGVIVYDTELRYLEWNTFMEKLTGMEKKAVVGKKTAEVFPNFHEQGIDKLLQRALTGETVSSPDIIYQSPKTGKSSWISGTYTPHRNSIGQIIGVIGIIRDITERKQAEEALKKSEYKFRTLFTSSHDGIATADPKGYITDCNQAYADMLGYSLEELKKLTYLELTPEKWHINNKEMVQKAIEKGSSEFEKEYTKKDGTILPVSLRTWRIDDDEGNIIGLCSIVRDITEHKLAEERHTAVKLLQELLLPPIPIEQKLKHVTDTVVRILDADFARVWTIKPGDRCKSDCTHAEVTEGPHVCRFRDKCLHLMASSGRYTHLDGKVHRRVPFGCYKIGLVASGEHDKFLTNEAATDPRVHNHDWVKELGLVSFAGYRLMHTDGTPLGVLALFSKHPISPEEDALLEGIAHSTSMVIHAAKIEEALRESEKRFQQIAENAQEWIWETDANGLYTYVSPIIEKLLGYKPEELVGQKYFYDLFPLEEREQLKKSALEVFARREPFQLFENRNVHKNGSIVWFITSGVPMLDDAGNLLGYRGADSDITKRKQTEEVLKKSKDELEQVNTQLMQSTTSANQMAKQAIEAYEAKRQFLANISHEIRTPMNAIIGFSDILAGEEMPEHQKEYVELIRQSGGHLLNMINDILDFSKADVGKLDLKKTVFFPSKIIDSVESLMRPEAEKKGLKFEIIKYGNLPVQIKGDPARLRQCLVNLVNNAIKFTEQGYVQLKIGQEQIDGKSFIRFDIEDSGIGIPVDQNEKIFESFVQLDGTASRKYSGAGLGLSITKQLTKLLGGQLTVTSESGKGSVFSLVVPTNIGIDSQTHFEVTDSKEQEYQDVTITEPVKFSGRVLVAEDVSTNQKLMSYLLEKMGLEVTMTDDGNKAVEKATSQPFDIIFMDIQMPNMNGYEATQAIRKEGINTPIIALTAHAMPGDEQKCFEAGCDSYLSKPLIYSKLIQTIAKYLGGEVFCENTDLTDKPGDPMDNENYDNEVENRDEVMIDWAKVTAGGLDEQIIKEVMPTYLDDSKKHLQELTAAVNTSNIKNVKLHAHAIKGTGRNMGVANLSEVAGQLETMAIQGDLSKAQELLKSIVTEFEKFEKFVSKPDWIEIAKNKTASKTKA